ncbi:MAG: RES domain-containing protein [Hyphomicrobiales bacterium]|nr:RES domain-containing protein [Hyphomicrobiales bacterium]
MRPPLRSTAGDGVLWSPRPDGAWDVPTLYTSLQRQGALSELCSFLADFTPVPKARLIKVTSLDIQLMEAVRLEPADLSRLGVDMTRYGTRDDIRTQQIGAALAFLEVDGLIAYTDSHNLPVANVTLRGRKPGQLRGPRDRFSKFGFLAGAAGWD